MPDRRSFDVDVTVRLDQRAPDNVLAEVLGIDGALATARLTGVASAAGWAATDGDRSTSWITPFGGAVGSTITFTADEPFDSFQLVQPAGDFSPITNIRVSGVDADVARAG